MALWRATLGGPEAIEEDRLVVSAGERPLSAQP